MMGLFSALEDAMTVFMTDRLMDNGYFPSNEKCHMENDYYQDRKARYGISLLSVSNGAIHSGSVSAPKYALWTMTIFRLN